MAWSMTISDHTAFPPAQSSRVTDRQDLVGRSGEAARQRKMESVIPPAVHQLVRNKFDIVLNLYIHLLVAWSWR